MNKCTTFTIVCPDASFHDNISRDENNERSFSFVDVAPPKVYDLQKKARIQGHISAHDALIERRHEPKGITLRVHWLPDPIPQLAFHELDRVHELRLSCPVPINWLFRTFLPLFDVLESINFGFRAFYPTEKEFSIPTTSKEVKLEPEPLPGVLELTCRVDSKIFNSYSEGMQKQICDRISNILRQAKLTFPNLNSIDLDLPISLSDTVKKFRAHYECFRSLGKYTENDDEKMVVYSSRRRRSSKNIIPPKATATANNDTDDEDEFDKVKNKKIKLECNDDISSESDSEIKEVPSRGKQTPDAEIVTISSDDDDDVTSSNYSPPYDERISQSLPVHGSSSRMNPSSTTNPYTQPPHFSSSSPWRNNHQNKPTSTKRSPTKKRTAAKDDSQPLGERRY